MNGQESLNANVNDPEAVSATAIIGGFGGSHQFSL
jgi:hypothetical protein